MGNLMAIKKGSRIKKMRFTALQYNKRNMHSTSTCAEHDIIATALLQCAQHPADLCRLAATLLHA